MMQQLPSMPQRVGSPPKRSALSVRPVLCFAGLAAACAFTRPREQMLLTVIDAHHDAFSTLDASLRSAPPELFDCGLACVGLHSDLVWLGLLGQWLPLLPMSGDAVTAWLDVVGAPQILLLVLTAGYLLRKLFGEGHLSACFDRTLRKARLHTLATASVCPTGLVHWLHAACALFACASGDFDETLGRKTILLLYAAAGACSALAAVVTQMIFGRRSIPRSSVSGATMGLILLRAAAMPETPVDLGAISLPPLRVALLHLGLDALSNNSGYGIEKLLALVGAAVLVAAVQPQLRGLFAETMAGGWDWRALLSQARAAL